MKLAVAVPCHVFVAPQMAMSLAGMFHDLGAHRVEAGLNFLGNAVSTFGRNALVRWARANDASAILWIDTDMMFPPDAARRLIQTREPFIGVNYAMRARPYESTASVFNGRMIPKTQGTEEVETIGFGLVLVALRVLDAVGEPWFTLDDKSVTGPHDDGLFCARARAAGYPPKVDHALSHECRHVGLHEFSLEVP